MKLLEIEPCLLAHFDCGVDTFSEEKQLSKKFEIN